MSSKRVFIPQTAPRRETPRERWQREERTRESTWKMPEGQAAPGSDPEAEAREARLEREEAESAGTLPRSAPRRPREDFDPVPFEDRPFFPLPGLPPGRGMMPRITPKYVVGQKRAERPPKATGEGRAFRSTAGTVVERLTEAEEYRVRQEGLKVSELETAVKAAADRALALAKAAEAVRGGHAIEVPETLEELARRMGKGLPPRLPQALSPEQREERERALDFLRQREVRELTEIIGRTESELARPEVALDRARRELLLERLALLRRARDRFAAGYGEIGSGADYMRAAASRAATLARGEHRTARAVSVSGRMADRQLRRLAEFAKGHPDVQEAAEFVRKAVRKSVEKGEPLTEDQRKAFRPMLAKALRDVLRRPAGPEGEEHPSVARELAKFDVDVKRRWRGAPADVLVSAVKELTDVLAEQAGRPVETRQAGQFWRQADISTLRKYAEPPSLVIGRPMSARSGGARHRVGELFEPNPTFVEVLPMYSQQVREALERLSTSEAALEPGNARRLADRIMAGFEKQGFVRLKRLDERIWKKGAEAAKAAGQLPPTLWSMAKANYDQGRRLLRQEAVFEPIGAAVLRSDELPAMLVRGSVLPGLTGERTADGDWETASPVGRFIRARRNVNAAAGQIRKREAGRLAAAAARRFAKEALKAQGWVRGRDEAEKRLYDAKVESLVEPIVSLLAIPEQRAGLRDVELEAAAKTMAQLGKMVRTREVLTWEGSRPPFLPARPRTEVEAESTFEKQAEQIVRERMRRKIEKQMESRVGPKLAVRMSRMRPWEAGSSLTAEKERELERVMALQSTRARVAEVRQAFIRGRGGVSRRAAPAWKPAWVRGPFDPETEVGVYDAEPTYRIDGLGALPSLPLIGAGLGILALFLLSRRASAKTPAAVPGAAKLVAPLRKTEMFVIDGIIDGTATKTHVVARGETLASIAKLHYGDTRWWPYLWDVNRAIIGTGHPDKLDVGTVLRVAIPAPVSRQSAIFARAAEHAAIWKAHLAAGRGGVPALPASVLDERIARTV